MKTLRRIGAMAGIVAAVGLVSATAATAEPPQTTAANASFTLAAADAAGWLVFPGHRSDRTEDLAPSVVRVSAVAPRGQVAPARAWLDRWGTVQANMAR